MKNIQLPKITLDRLLSVEVGESGYIIMPINFNHTMYSFLFEHGTNNFKKDVAIAVLSPLQQGDKFFLGEEFACDKGSGDYIYTKDLKNVPREFIATALQMQPHQSRFPLGTCLNVEVVKPEEMDFDKALTFYPYETCDEDGLAIYEHLELYVDDLASQHNKLHGTNIIPSMDDYVFLLEVRREK